MLGIFNNGQPRIEFEVKGIGLAKKLIGVIDSGFNGYLKLPFAEALPLGLILSGAQDYTHGDGSTSSNLVCKGQVCIDGKSVNTTIDIHKANIILIGTQLLRDLGKRFVLKCDENLVEITD